MRHVVRHGQPARVFVRSGLAHIYPDPPSEKASGVRCPVVSGLHHAPWPRRFTRLTSVQWTMVDGLMDWSGKVVFVFQVNSQVAD